MSDIKIAYRITAVKERLKYALETAETLNLPKECIYLDSKRRGNIWNKFRIYEELKEQDIYTHVCMNDDDTIPVENYIEIIEAATKNFPDAIITFYKPESKLSDRYDDSPYVQLLNNDCLGPGMVIPCKYLNDILSFYNAYLKDIRYKWDDTTVKMWSLINDVPVILTVPNLIFCRPLPSTVRGAHLVQPNGETWIGRTVDVTQFATNKLKIMKTGSMFNTHLPKSHFLNNVCKRKFAEKKNMVKERF